MRPPLFDPPPVDPKVRRWQAIRTVLIFAAISAVFPAFYLFESWRGKIAWQAYEREAKLRGAKMALADIVPPPVPDAENFASIPILDAAFAASDAGEKVKNPLSLTGTNDAGTNRLKVGDLLKQQKVDLEAVRTKLVEANLLESTTDNVAADVLRGLDSFAEALQQLREAGQRPHCRFPVHWEKHFAAILPHLGILQDGARVFSLRASAHLAMGNSAAAYEDFHDGLCLVTAIRDEPSMLCGLVRVSMTDAMLNAVWSGLANGAWAEPELRRIEAELAGLDWLRDYCWSLNSERWCFIAMGDVLIQDPSQFAGVSSRGDDKKEKDAFRFYPSGWFQHSKVRFNRYIDELTARLDPEQRRIFLERPLPSSPTHLTSTPAKIYYLYFGIAGSVFETVDTKLVHMASLCDMARLACALERRRLAYGDFPIQLAELSPDYLPSIPVEVVNGEPYRYRRADAGSFVLYSVGKDMRDDGGGVDAKADFGKQKDWVWRASQREPGGQ